MVNTDRIRRLALYEHGSITAFAKDIGISRQNLYNKLNGICRWSAEDVSAIRRSLKLSDEDFMDIFFN